MLPGNSQGRDGVPALVLKLLLEVTGKLACGIGQRLGPALGLLGLHQLKGSDVK